ncbi:hypothetical protein [Aerococcus christensenii]|uniref:hypothetical protein n=1 Tax=Aerococcus christensenii TaxID=87541 RepID=UPI0023A9BE08|nr:hypothetical protein [Aerococcus christensenii]WEB70248.1 hypothetical protein PUW42_04060 [Aerococcus christensenii]
MSIYFYQLILYGVDKTSVLKLIYAFEKDAKAELCRLKEQLQQNEKIFEPDPSKEISGIKLVNLENIVGVQTNRESLGA